MHDSVGGALEAFERMEERVVRAEVEAEVLSESNPQLLDTSAIDAYAADEALAALKAKLAAGELASGSPASKGKPDPKDPIEDTLAQMKAKLRKEEGK
jgi:phage shock protein A